MINKIKYSLNSSVESMLGSNLTKVLLLLFLSSCTDNVYNPVKECESVLRDYEKCLWNVLESRAQDITLEDAGLDDSGVEDMSLGDSESENESETPQVCLKELAKVSNLCGGLEIPDVGIPNFGMDATVSNDQGVDDVDMEGMMNSMDQGVNDTDTGGMMNSMDRGVDDADTGGMMNSMDQGEDDTDTGGMMNSIDRGVPVEDQAVEVDAMLPENSVEDFNDPDLIMVNNSYPTCFVNFPRQEMSLRSIFQRFFHGLNDGSIEFSEVCPTQFSNIDVEYSAVMPELREEIIANGCYVFTGFNFITSHLHSNQVFTESHFLEDVVTRNVYEIRNRNDRYWIKVYSTTGTTTNITHCDE